ncbi:hypothetical protein MACH17_38950 [Phaeobacter inhibens]|nr:hypothetical protein MACH17_38950 [Phaeobacter inhibens]
MGQYHADEERVALSWLPGSDFHQPNKGSDPLATCFAKNNFSNFKTRAMLLPMRRRIDLGGSHK